MNCDRRTGLTVLAVAALFVLCPLLNVGCSSAEAGSDYNIGFGQGDGFTVAYIDSETEGLGILDMDFEALPSGEAVYLTIDGNTSAPISQSDVSSIYVPRMSKGVHTISVECGGYRDSAVMTVKAFVAVESITLSQESADLYVGDSVVLTATIVPSDATYQEITWGSDDTSVATVDNGRITAVSAGTARITAECGGITATCTVNVTVFVPVTDISLDAVSKDLKIGETFVLKATVVPDNATDKTVRWSSGNLGVASVNGGTVTAVSAGTATITAESNGRTAICIVTVKESEISDTETTIETDEKTGDVTKTTTTTTVFPDGSITVDESITVKDKNGNELSSTESRTAVTEGTDGSISKDTVSVTTKKDGSKTETSQSVVTKTDGSIISDESEKNTDPNGIITKERTVSVIDSKVVTTAKETADSSGNIKRESVSAIESQTMIDGTVAKTTVEKSIIDTAAEQIKTVKEKIPEVEPVVEVTVSTASGVRTVSATISAESVSKVSGDAGIRLKSSLGTVVLNNASVKNVSKENADVSISFSLVDKDIELSEDQKRSVGDSPVYDIDLSAGDKKIHELGGKATVIIPYTLSDGADPSKVAIWYLKDDGSLVKVDNAVYDPETKTVTFTVDHFSKYVVDVDTSDDSNNNGTGLNSAVIVGIVVAIVLIVAAGVIVFVIMKKKKNNGGDKTVEE